MIHVRQVLKGTIIVPLIFTLPAWADTSGTVVEETTQEPYTLLLQENEGLKEKLAEINTQINDAMMQVEELMRQVAIKNDKLAMLKKEDSLDAEKGAGITAGAGEVIGNDKPYKVIDGQIDKNTLQGWKTFRGIGACTSCHGPTGTGGVGLNLLATVKEKDKDFFTKIVAEGKKGTQMVPYKNNEAVMKNVDNIYAYFKARVDGVLGPENLIKYPLGKKELEVSGK